MDASDESRSDDLPARQGPGAFPLSALLVVPIVMAVAGGIGVLVIVQLQFVPVRVLLIGGLPYAIVALVVATTLRLRAWRRPIDEQVEDVCSTGRSSAQRITFATASWLIVLWIAVAAVWAGDLGSSVVVVGGPLAAGAVLSIAANARLLYSPRVALAEVGAVRTHAPGRGWILANWILAPVSWFAFAIPGWVLAGSWVL
ncbi:hypothetical protein SAMN06295885_0743 [Rathayibacter oskolensis]|uniref:Uncharacterized protein n=1 Tax=Rathayibacter oskolensis TaxID=1891671 RepID=A0A1X7N7G1_9MICO|nr:hypothetical protein [Rathayibacter oskolensis]SMH32472.1 hypothetical protein SAMN06295885_0743 [Rathayibacter oskolensis]